MEQATSSEGSGDSGGRDHIVVEINESLATSIRRKMESISSSHSICKINESLLKANEKAYVPAKVSIGPYHHGKEQFKFMEEHKWRYVYALLSRRPNLETVLDDCVAALKQLEGRAVSCYSEKTNFTSDEFLKIMLIDGCFLIELFMKYSMKSLRRRNDIIFSTAGMLFDLRCDFILLENQIPLFVLLRLFQLVPIPKQCTFSLPELAFRYFKNMIPGDQNFHREKFNEEGHHLLDLIGHCLLPKYPKLPKKLAESERQLHSATELRRNGIKFKRSWTENLLDIRFGKNVLEIPPIILHQYTESLFRNLIQLEHCSRDNVQHITSYAFLMKSLIRNEKDVKLLEKRDILINYDAAEKEVPKFFDRICQEVTLNESYYDGLFEHVYGYGRGTRSWSKRLKRSYQRNPMLRLVLIIAILALLLTVIGTLFSVLSFSLHRL
ncbi:hypothetical protein K2173_022544 [Erythroxylum novogranatense]|uniref:Uncharacterized protein n=1 Tax=Erythroxylum novogranatense TaxID=1862640 RepID=A0AAV8TKC1_9ROSI|nr:hypothetical protein K2173_022544 [Erythroxylum novogranatense]